MRLTEQRAKPIWQMEAAKYYVTSLRFTYETYVLIFEKNMLILSRYNEEIRDARVVQKFLPGIECPWFAAGKDFVTVPDAHKNDFAKTMAYLASLYNTWVHATWVHATDHHATNPHAT